MATEDATALQEFIAYHEAQLKSIQFPSSLTADLFAYFHQDYDNDILENAFEIRKFENSRSMLFAKNNLKCNANFFLIDHVWTSDGGKKAYEELKKSPERVEKLSSLFRIPPAVDVVSSYDIEKQIQIVSSLCGCDMERAEKALHECSGATVSALCDILDGKSDAQERTSKRKTEDKCSFEEFKASLAMNGVEVEKENEAYLQKMYQNFLLEGDGCANTLTYNWSDDGNTITVFVSIPGITKKDSVKSALDTHNWKLVVADKEMINGELHESVKPDECYWAIESPGVLCMTLEKVYEGNIWPELIKGEDQLSSMDIISTGWIKEKGLSLHLSEVLDAMWMYNQTYAMMSSDGIRKQPVWYIMDDYGSALTHNIDPNFRCSPFFHIQKGQAYSLMWPIKDITKGSVCTRNFIPQLMPNETLDICKVRIKAFTGMKIHKNLTMPPTLKQPRALEEEKVNITHIQDLPENDIEYTYMRSVDLSDYAKYTSQDMLANLKLTTSETNNNADIYIKMLKDTSIKIDSDILPTGQMISNKQYLQSYLKFRFDDFDCFRHSYILPRDLEAFNREYELTNLPQYWILKAVDRKLLDVPTVVSSCFSRIVRMCEIGPIAVSKYVVDQPQLHRRRFSLVYSIVINTSNNDIFVYKVPLIRLTKKEYAPNAMINEYDNSCEVTESPGCIVGNQELDTYKDFKIAMNRLLLPKNPKKGWEYYQNIVFQRIGILTKPFADDLCVEKGKNCFVLFSADVIFDDNINPIIIDINGVGNLPNKGCLVNTLELVCGCPNEHFVKII